VLADGHSDAAARCGDDTQHLELAMQCTALHPDEARGFRDVAAKAVYLGDEVFALEQLTRLAERKARYQRHDGAETLVALRPRRGARQLVGIDLAAFAAKDQKLLHQVAELADISRPIARLHCRD